MALNKKELDRIVDFVKAVKELPGNEEFIAALREVIGDTHSKIKNKEQGVSSDKLETIELYLGLDYTLDTAIPSIDYSFVSDNVVRTQLEADNREMLRYRYGTRGHKVDFLEFCRFVQLQLEGLLRYYYEVRFNGDDAAILEHLKKYNTHQIGNNYTYVNMLYGFNSEFKIKSFILDSVRKVRNSQSHRGSQDIDLDLCVRNAQKFAKTHHLFIQKDGSFTSKVRNTIQESEELNGEFKSEVGLLIGAYNSMVFQKNFLQNTPFLDVIKGLAEHTNAVAKEIANLKPAI